MTLRYDFAPLEAFLDGVPPRRAFNRDRSQIARWRTSGITSLVADRLATMIGLHPSVIWPTWFDDADLEDRCPWCGEIVLTNGNGSYCSTQHRRLMKSERDHDANRREKWEKRLDRYARDFVEPDPEESEIAA